MGNYKSLDGHIRALFHLVVTHLLHCWSRVHTTPAIEGFPPSSERGRMWSVGERGELFEGEKELKTMYFVKCVQIVVCIVKSGKGKESRCH